MGERKGGQGDRWIERERIRLACAQNQLRTYSTDRRTVGKGEVRVNSYQGQRGQKNNSLSGLSGLSRLTGPNRRGLTRGRQCSLEALLPERAQGWQSRTGSYTYTGSTGATGKANLGHTEG